MAENKTPTPKSSEVMKLVEGFRKYLTTQEAKEHLDYLRNREPRETKEVLDKLKRLKKGDQEFTELVLYGLLPNGKTKYAKRVSTAPAFLNIRKFFKRFGYTDGDFQKIAELVFDLFVEYEQHPTKVGEIIKKFTANKYSKALQCGSLSPVFYSLNNRFPIVNNRVKRTYNNLSILAFGRKTEISQKIADYTDNIQKIGEFTKTLSNDYGLNEIQDTAVFDLFCYWFDEHFRKENEPRQERKQKETEEPSQGNDIFEDTEEEQALDIPVEAKKVIWQPKDYSIRELFEMCKDGELQLQPKFQRFFVWDDTKSSRLMESIFLDVPIPVIYLSEEPDGKFTVIDGQQRLTSFFKFYDGTLGLRGLLVFAELNGKKFPDLDAELKSKFKKATIHTIVVKKESQEDIRFEIFERLNTGSVKLNDQELRNCIYRGEYNDFLDELSQDDSFLTLLGLEAPHKRMMDRELILRFFAFYHRTYLKYNSPMKSFLNKEMENQRSMTDKDVEELRQVFKKSVELSKYVFGENAFRRFIVGDSSDSNGIWERHRVNKALFDFVMYGFTDYEKHQIVPKSDSIREELIWLMSHDQEFIDAITISTNDKAKVLLRFERWLRSLREIVGYPVREPRSFSSEIKKGLFDSNNTCALCKQEIKFPDDAEVDHLEFYWRGGKTIPSNARLTHRYCNRYRGGREEQPKIVQPEKVATAGG